MLLQCLHFLLVKLYINIFCEIKCVLLDSNINVVEKDQYMYNIIVFH